MSGKVLLKSIVVANFSCSDCAFDSRISVSLVGKRTAQQPGGVTCSSASLTIDLLTSDSRTSLDTEDSLNTCYKVSQLVIQPLIGQKFDINKYNCQTNIRIQ